MNGAASVKLVSVLIPAFNAEHTVGRALASVIEQDHPRTEIVVVDDGSTDATRETLRRYGDRIRVLRNARRMGIAATINRAFNVSRGEIIVILASDCALLGRRYLSEIVERLIDETVGAVTGAPVMSRFETADAATRIFACINLLDVNRRAAGIHRINFVELRADGFRRRTLVEAGPLDERLLSSNEDQDLSLRILQAGYTLLQDDDLRFELSFGGTQDTWLRLLAKQAQYGFGQAYITLMHGLGLVRIGWNNPNRRRRALHRFGQGATIPIVAATASAAAISPVGTVTLVGWLIARACLYLALTKSLRAWERLVAAAAGICADFAYSIGFAGGTIVWSTRLTAAALRTATHDQPD